jgi:hypothetical protein
MNRHQRRAAEKVKAARLSAGEKAAQARIQAAQTECQRLGAMYQNCQQALQLLGQIPEVEKKPEWTEEDGDPNFFKNTGAEDFLARLVETREGLILAHEEFYLALEALDPRQAPLLAVPPRLVQ